MASQAYKLKNFNQILSWYATIVKNRMLADEAGLGANSPFNPPSWTIVTTDELTGMTTTQVIMNPGGTYGQSILDAFKNTANSILHSLKTLFINYDDDKQLWHEDMNFNLLNSYAAASQSFQKYNQDTEEFEDRPEYWFTRGCWYDMLPMCTKGEYLYAWRNNVENGVVAAITKCREAFRKHVYTYTTTTYTSVSDGGADPWTTHTYTETYSDEGNSRGFITDFWGDHLASLKSTVDSLLEPIWKLGRKTSYPEQNAASADLVYVTQLKSDIASQDTGAAKASSSSITTAKSLSKACGKYDAKAAKMTLKC